MLRDEIAKLNDMGLVDELLKDKSTDKNILWATNAYSHLGKEYAEDKEITADLITGKNCGVITNRAQKEKEAKATRTKQYAEVFTPFWICKRMNDSLDDDWLDCVDEEENGEALEFREGKTWQDYVSSVRMEITCGEAPFLTSRYDVATGEDIPLNKRIGLLDRKLRAVGENTDSFDEWLEWAKVAFRSTYGYEFQGDNLLIARINLLMTFEDNFVAKWGRAPEKDQYAKIMEIIAWNIWQMDGLTNCVPYSEPEKESEQITLDYLFGVEDKQECCPCEIYDWKDGKIIKYSTLSKRSSKMKFDYIIGNPPYQETSAGEKKADDSLYNIFMEEAYKVSNKVELITPARFLFHNGNVSADWVDGLLNSEHFKVLCFEPKASKVFPDATFKGGVAIHYFDANATFEPIKHFTQFEELNGILKKVASKDESSLTTIMYNQNKFNLEKLFTDFPEVRFRVSSNGKEKRLTSACLSFECFHDDRESDSDVEILGFEDNTRVHKFIDRKYLQEKDSNLDKYKVIVPANNGSGALGEVLSTPLIGEPLIGEPLIGYTQTFIGIGSFDSREEAEACLKYVRTKFARVMLGVLKVTQNGKSNMWKYVPIQDFSNSYDIDWSESVNEIDQQLYKKYGLSDEEIEFIESHVKEME